MQGGYNWLNINQGEYLCMCFHLYPTGFCCQGSAMNWFISPEDHVYSARLCIISHSPSPTVPMPVHVERRYSQLPICTLLCGACLLTNGPEERSKESPVRASQCCAAAAIWGDNGWGGGKVKDRGRDGGTERRRCSQNKPLKSSLKSSDCMGSVPATDIQSISVKTSLNETLTLWMCLKRDLQKTDAQNGCSRQHTALQ